MLSYQNLPETFYLGVYRPLTGEYEGYWDFTGYSSGILDLKNGDSLAINYFFDCIHSNLAANDFDCILVVPPHHSCNNKSGIQLLGQKIAKVNNLIDATSCLMRHKNIDKLSTGGNRNLETHLKSIKVFDEEVIQGKDVLLFDDISTTGNSLKACKKILEDAGVKTVKCFVLSKTIRCEENLSVFFEQHEIIEQNIVSAAYDEQKITEQGCEFEMQILLDEYQTEMEDLLYEYKQDYFSKEEFDDFSEQIYLNYLGDDLDIFCKSETTKETINYYSDLEMDALNNLYEFSGLCVE